MTYPDVEGRNVRNFGIIEILTIENLLIIAAAHAYKCHRSAVQ